MPFKPLIFVLAAFLLVAPRVSSYEDTFWEVLFAKAPVKAPAVAAAPVKAPSPSPKPKVLPPVKAPSPYPKPKVLPPVKAPSPSPKVLPPVEISECPGLCAGRCKLHSRIRHCTRVCVTCCQRCKCVPPGTYGNKEMCGKCYTEMTTHNNKLKCP